MKGWSGILDKVSHGKSSVKVREMEKNSQEGYHNYPISPTPIYPD
jgi:hypothetical protein